MRIDIVKRSGVEYEAMIAKHKETGKYSFINLTRSIICPCEFDTIDDALDDLNSRTDIKMYTIKGGKESDNSEECHILIGESPNITALAGFEYGKYAYLMHVRPFVDIRRKYILHFPQQITLLSISYVQGFSSHMDKDLFKQMFEIRGNKKFAERFACSLDF